MINFFFMGGKPIQPSTEWQPVEVLQVRVRQEDDGTLVIANSGGSKELRSEVYQFFKTDAETDSEPFDDDDFMGVVLCRKPKE